MPVPNRKCNHCGKPYFVCKGCISVHSYKNAFCSIECFREDLKKQEEKIIEPIIIEEKEEEPTKEKVNTKKKK